MRPVSSWRHLSALPCCLSLMTMPRPRRARHSNSHRPSAYQWHLPSRPGYEAQGRIRMRKNWYVSRCECKVCKHCCWEVGVSSQKPNTIADKGVVGEYLSFYWCYTAWVNIYRTVAYFSFAQQGLYLIVLWHMHVWNRRKISNERKKITLNSVRAPLGLR